MWIKIIAAGLLSFAFVFFVGWRLAHRPSNQGTRQTAPGTTGNPFNKRYSQGKCQGSGTVPFTHSPMALEDIGMIQPYGLMVDAHVIPTSHGYISPKVFDSPQDAYPVYAIADGFIVNVSYRGQSVGDTSSGKPANDYQLYFEMSCSFWSYYDLLTSLAPEIEKVVGKLSGFDHKQVRIQVKAGQLVGRIGGKTLDFAVWNFDEEPAYFVNPASYRDDEDRPYLEDMFKHFVEPISSQLLVKNIRTSEPRTGKVAYDIDGKLVGNWFEEGSGGFSGRQGSQQEGSSGRYWDGHLAMVYDFIDPTQLRFSIGDFDGRAAQFGVKGNGPDPANVSTDSGVVTFELQQFEYFDIGTGRPLGRALPSQAGVGARNFEQIRGTALVQLINDRTLKLEVFSGKTKDQVSGFTNQARTYLR